MIKYDCEKCGAGLETDAAPGTRDQCPACHHVNVIPEPAPSILSRIRDRASDALEARREKATAAKQARESAQSAEADARAAAEAVEARSQARAEAQAQAWRAAHERLGGTRLGLAGGQAAGILLVVVGIITVVACLAMDVSVGFGYERVANLDKMNLRLLGVIIGVGLFLAGTIINCLNSIHRSLWTIAVQALADLKDHRGTKG